MTDQDLALHMLNLHPQLILCGDTERARLISIQLVTRQGPEAQVTVAQQVCNVLVPQCDMEIIQADSVPSLCTKNTQVSSPCSESDLLCVAATSGSRRQPKYVLLRQASFIHRMKWQRNLFPLLRTDVVMIKSSPMFVDSIWELLSPAVFGQFPRRIFNTLLRKSTRAKCLTRSCSQVALNPFGEIIPIQTVSSMIQPTRGILAIRLAQL